MQNQQTQKINQIRSEFEAFKNQVNKINMFGYDVSHLDNLILQIQQIQHKLHQMIDDHEIIGQIPKINEEMEQQKKMLEEMKQNFIRNNQLQQPNNYSINQIEEIRLLKISNERMAEHIRKLKENQERQDKKLEENQEKYDNKLEKLIRLFDTVLQKTKDLDLQLAQSNNQVIQQQIQIEEKTLKINQLEGQILQIQQKMTNNNLLALTQQQQANQSLKNQIGNINQQLAQISQYQSIQHSQNSNS